MLAAHSETAALRAAKADADARIERLHAWLKALERHRYGRRSEAPDPGQYAFVFEEVGTRTGAAEAVLDAATSAPARDRTPRPRKMLPDHLERVEGVVEPEVKSCACGCEGRVKIGEGRQRAARRGADARRILGAWRADYNHARPHTSLGGLTPREFATRSMEDQTENIANL